MKEGQKSREGGGEALPHTPLKIYFFAASVLMMFAGAYADYEPRPSNCFHNYFRWNR